MKINHWQSYWNNLYKKYYNLFDNRVSKFVNSNILEQQINQQFEQNISTVKYHDPYKTAHIKTFDSPKNEELDALNCLKGKGKKLVEDAVKNKKIKEMIDFDLTFIQYFQKRQFGDQFYLKQTFIRFFLQQFLYLAFEKF